MAAEICSLFGVNFVEIAKGLLVRLMFAVHSGICALVVVDLDVDGPRLWPIYMYAGFVVLLLMEAAWCLCGVKKGYNWKVFSPTVALYIVCTAACIWCMELQMYDDLRRKDEKYDSGGNNSQLLNYTQLNPAIPTEQLFKECELPQVIDCELPIIRVVLTLQIWTEFLLQWMIFTLVIGRWLLPKGELTRDQLSQLLLVQIGMGADILELIEEGMGVNVKSERDVFLVLAVWSWSLPQFTLSLTVTKARKSQGDPRPAKPSIPYRELEEKDFFGWGELCCATEMWSVFLTSIVMQDLPFLALRLYIMFSSDASPGQNLSSQAIFFSFKNLLVILLQMYRMVVIVAENQRKKAAWKRRGAVDLNESLRHRVTARTPGPAEEPYWAPGGAEPKADKICQTTGACTCLPLHKVVRTRVDLRDAGTQTAPSTTP